MAKISKIKGESVKNFEALKMYVELSDRDEDSVFQKIADYTGKSIKTIYNWSNKYKWKIRYEEYRLEANKRAMDKLIRKKEKFDIRLKNKIMDKAEEVIDNVVGTWDGSYATADATNIIKLYQLVFDQPTEITDNKTSHTITEADKETLEKFSAGIIADIQNAKVGEEDEDDD